MLSMLPRFLAMKADRFSVLCAALFVASCASNVDGMFEPACIAYEGDRIALLDGRFEWQRFTDQIVVDENGDKVNAFPGYPLVGTYELQNERVSLIPDGSAETRERYLLEHRNELYLLTYDENEAVLDGEKMPICALRRATQN